MLEPRCTGRKAYRDENQVGKGIKLYMNKRTGQKAALKIGRQSSEGGKFVGLKRPTQQQIRLSDSSEEPGN